MDETVIDEQEVQLYPPWREALKAFLAAGFEERSVVSHDWFYAAFGLEMPTPTTPNGTAEAIKLKHLSQLESLKKALLEDHKIHLQIEQGHGYRIVPPEEQTKNAMDELQKSMRKAIRDGGRRLYHTDLQRLTDEQRKEHSDALSTFGRLRQMEKQARKLPSLESVE